MTMLIQCLIIDDEPPAIKVLQSHIANLNGLEVVACCKNAVEAMDILQEKHVDLIFLDIKMPKITGIQFLKQLPNIPKVIIVTAYREFAMDGYEFDVVDFLLKPVSFERFFKAIGKVKRQMGYETISQENEYKSNKLAFVYLKVGKKMQKILVNKISHIESWKDYSRIYQTDGSYCLVRQSITVLENLLSTYKFLRVHRSFLVSLDKITSFSHYDVQIGLKEIPIGRLYKQQVMEAINRSRS